MLNRRSFVALAGIAPLSARAATSPRKLPSVNVLRPPDFVSHHSAAGTAALKQAGLAWQMPGISITTESEHDSELSIVIDAVNAEVEHLHLRWNGPMDPAWRYLADHWERSYGDLEWRASVPDRLMPWYFLVSNRSETHGYGVRTGAAAVCFWQADPAGISLWLDLRNGGGPTRFAKRRFTAATVVMSSAASAPFRAARDFCRRLCPHPRLPAAPVYGGNNWYYTYGIGFTAEDILHDSELLSEWAPPATINRPFMVIDMGWNPNAEGAGPDSHGNERFPDMPGLAAAMKQRGVRPGIWIRPLLTVENLAESWRLRDTKAGHIIDPSVPDALQHVRESVERIHGWGYEMIKHDYSTYDLYGRWGYQMGVRLTEPGWHFADRGRTTAEIISAFYRAIREGAGSSLLIGCNTIGHLGAGLFELQRIGDDTSGRDWERTRKMGVNALAFRLPQHNTFFAADADCVPVTPAVPWDLTRQWLDLVAHSGTPLFVSADPKSTGAEQKTALRAAFALAAKPQPAAEPLDWFDSTAPEKWSFGGKPVAYQWYAAKGASPFAT